MIWLWMIFRRFWHNSVTRIVKYTFQFKYTVTDLALTHTEPNFSLPLLLWMLTHIMNVLLDLNTNDVFRISLWCTTVSSFSKCHVPTLPLARSHYLGFPQFLRWESFHGLSAFASGTDTLPMCSSGLLGISLRHGPFSFLFFFSFFFLAALTNSMNHSVGRSEKVSRICWSSCSVLAHLEGQQTFKSGF